MIERVIVLHQSGSVASSGAPWISSEDAEWLVWKTCLRTIWIGVRHPADPAPSAGPEIEIRRGLHAYRFLLEVACGLHSPLLGETEVMGQFKNLLKRLDLGYELRILLGSVLTDAKAVRREHLANLGSQSYGSLARKYLRDTEAVHLLGAGALVEDLLPWMKSFRNVSVFSRVSKANSILAKKFPGVTFSTLTDSHTHEEESSRPENFGLKASGRGPKKYALVVAAAMSARAVGKWIAEHDHSFDVVLDLRGEADSDPLLLDGVIRLSTFFSGVASNLDGVREKATQAFDAIGELVRAKELAREIRPFGWDDLCA